jgi:hypothetical protein
MKRRTASHPRLSVRRCWAFSLLGGSIEIHPVINLALNCNLHSLLRELQWSSYEKLEE